VTVAVILAAGRGTRIGRVGDSLHKCLVPLQNKAIISHQIEKFEPYVDRYVIALGYRGDQIREYISFAHPDIHIQYVEVDGWDKPGGGPGASLLACKKYVAEEDMIFTSCDTLWEDIDFPDEYSWSAVAPVPAGTPAARWCRMHVDNYNRVTRIMDKTPEVSDTAMTAMAYTGMSYIIKQDLGMFWFGLEHFIGYPGELEISRGLVQIERLNAIRINWTDVGDEESYRHAVSAMSGFDWVKAGQATYVLRNVVIKFHEDPSIIEKRYVRGMRLSDAIPKDLRISKSSSFISYKFVPGDSLYKALDEADDIEELIVDFLTFIRNKFFDPEKLIKDPEDIKSQAMQFYREKTFERVMMLPSEMRSRALDVATSVDWEWLIKNVIVGNWHGDLNAGNVIYDMCNHFTLIDWREDFAGTLQIGDLRYDLAKLMAGCVVHWDNAQRGDFRPWEHQELILNRIREFMHDDLQLDDEVCHDIEVIGALSLINCAPLHSSPLDEVLVSRAVQWMERLQ
jgi:NDP-sugar pyrophosphorylase family protein